MLVFTDRGPTPCVLQGTPQVRFLDDKGETSAVSVVYSSQGMFPTWPNDGVGLVPLSTQPPPRGVRGQAGLPMQGSSLMCPFNASRAVISLPSGALVAWLGIDGTGPSFAGCLPPSVTVNPFQPAEAYR